MEDKSFELISKMYAEMHEGFKEIKEEIRDVKLDILTLENKMDTHHKALYDGYVQNSESINGLQQEVAKLTDKVEHQEIKLQVVKGL
jgi:predicted  nucleic acid-binding Zn-ribbon protein